MTNYEAILELDGVIDCCECTGVSESQIEAVRIAIAALKKQEPTRPKDIKNYGNKYKIGSCPICYEGANSYMNYCDRCGQGLDWSDSVGKS